MKTDRLPPQDLESERCLLGACFDHRSAHSDFDLDVIRTIVSPEMFYTPQHGQLFQAIVDCADNDEPLDVAAILPRLQRADSNGEWKETITDIIDEGEPANCLFYAKRIREAWTRRTVIRHCQKVSEQAHDLVPDASVDDLIEEFHKLPVNRTDARGGIANVCMTDVESETVQWLWPGRIAIGKLTLLIGDPDLGKSFVSLDIASRVSTGTSWPDRQSEKREPASVLLVNAEDGLADTVRHRLENARADLTRIHAVTGVRHSEHKGELDVLSLARDLRHLAATVDRVRDCRLLVLDPLDAFLGAKVDSHKSADVRRVIAPLATLATERGIAVLLVAHLNKAEKMAAIYRSMGSIGFTAAARAVWLIVSDKDDPTKRLMLQVKNNLALDPGGLAFHISQPGVVAWSTTPVALSADEALAPDRPKARKARDDATAFLKDLLADGPVPASDVYRHADEAGIAKKTLQRAKDKIGVVTRPVTTAGERRWYWSLEDGQPAHV